MIPFNPGLADSANGQPKPIVPMVRDQDTLDPGQLLAIHLRIAGGYYNQPEVLRLTAERLLESGHLAFEA